MQTQVSQWFQFLQLLVFRLHLSCFSLPSFTPPRFQPLMRKISPLSSGHSELGIPMTHSFSSPGFSFASTRLSRCLQWLQLVECPISVPFFFLLGMYDLQLSLHFILHGTAPYPVPRPPPISCALKARGLSSSPSTTLETTCNRPIFSGMIEKKI